MTHNQHPGGDDSPSPQTYEIAPDVLEQILQPDEPLAAQFLDRGIAAAEANPQTDQEALELLRLQRSFVDMAPDKAYYAAQKFAKETGKYATFAHTGGRRPPQIHYPLDRSQFVPRMANEERWHIAGIDPSEYNETPRGRAYTGYVEESWRQARQAREALQAAQTAEAQAMERASHPEFYVTREAA